MSEPPRPRLRRHAVDVSNYTRGFTSAAADVWQAQNDVGLVIVQSLDAARFPLTLTRQHLRAAELAELAVDLYVYPFFANGAADASERLSGALGSGVPVRRVWLDVEDVDPSQAAWTPQQRVEMLKRWLAACDDFPARVKPAGIYTGRWYWASSKYMANSTVFADRPLWDSNYDGVDVADYGFVPYGGWVLSDLAIKQYRGTSNLAGVEQVDLNVLSEAERELP